MSIREAGFDEYWLHDQIYDNPMTQQTQQILKKALSLPPIERAELVEKVFDSFNGSSKINFDHLWAQEAESRIDAFEKGKLKSISVKKVFQRIEKLKKCITNQSSGHRPF